MKPNISIDTAYLTEVKAGGQSSPVPSAIEPPKSSVFLPSLDLIYPCVNVTDAFRAGSYAKSFCLVDTNLTYDVAATNCVKNGMKIYEPMSIEDPLFFYTNGDQQVYNKTEQIFIVKTEEFYADLNLYCMGYVLYRELYQKTSVDCGKPSYSFCEFKKTQSKIKNLTNFHVINVKHF